MESSYPAVRRSLQGFTKTLAPTVDAGLRVNGLDDLRRAAGGVDVDVRAGRGTPAAEVSQSLVGRGSGGGPTVNITNNYPQAKPDSKTRDEVAQAIRLAAIV